MLTICTQLNYYLVMFIVYKKITIISKIKLEIWYLSIHEAERGRG